MPTLCLGWKTEFLLFQSCCPRPPACKILLALSSPFLFPPGYLGETSGSPGPVPHFSAFLGHRGPLDAPQASYAPGPASTVAVGHVKERRRVSLALPAPPWNPAPASSLSQPYGVPLAQSPNCKNACSFQVLLSSSSGFLQTQLSGSPRTDKTSPRGGGRWS